MSDGFVVVCEDDGILFGVGNTIREAWQDAEHWILDAVRDEVTDQVRGGFQRIGSDLTWRAHPATKALMDSVGERGGHDDWHEVEGVLHLGKQEGDR
jgi:hypothetical protein